MRLLDGLMILRSRSDRHHSLYELSHCGRRLHRCMSEQGDVIFRFVYLGGSSKLSIHITHIPDNLLRLARSLLQRLAVSFGFKAGVLAWFPLDLELLAALHSRPSTVGDHCDASPGLEPVRRFERF